MQLRKNPFSQTVSYYEAILHEHTGICKVFGYFL